MAAMSDSLKRLHTKGETQGPQMAESARKRKSQPTRDNSGLEESDADALLADTNKRQKVVNESSGATCASGEDEADALLDEIAQSLTETENTAYESWQYYRTNDRYVVESSC